jgi:hypothetical protein
MARGLQSWAQTATSQLSLTAVKVVGRACQRIPHLGPRPIPLSWLGGHRLTLLPAPGVEQASCWAQKTGPRVRTAADEGCAHGCEYALCLCHRPLWGLRMVEGLHHVVTQTIHRYNLLVYGLAPLEGKGVSSSCTWGRSPWSSIDSNLG